MLKGAGGHVEVHIRRGQKGFFVDVFDLDQHWTPRLRETLGPYAKREAEQKKQAILGPSERRDVPC